ncbi:AAA family ATPase [Chryseobacterium aquaticum]|uniref:AAA family ATPase n=1 Tax=Chryseobacterium aquaticum TaxID=452084 RepID=A0A848N7L5_9FLAO|nr:MULTISPECIES: AAA family ATPase [Chryseobacterium]NMR34349.1 AAA family ATPase [Chryseobacterium aquaticum]NRQ46667.1 AAA family ATPase [Chryseobacterium sp. C-204]
MSNFDTIKNDILGRLRNNSFEKCFLVRNIFSRFAIYIISNNEINKFKEEIIKEFQNSIDTIERISLEKDSFIVNDLEKTSQLIEGTYNVYFSERHIENTNWFINEKYNLNTPVTSFYSFKGGVGRTTATVLSALLLARQGKKVMIVDFDLEAPGLASIFANRSDNAEELLSVNGFVDFLIDYEFHKRDFAKINLDDYYFRINEQALVGSNGGELLIIPAITTSSENSSNYISKLSKANIRFGFGNNYAPDIFLQAMEDKLKPDHILIDTRTGINDVGGLVFNRYAQNIFLLFYGNQQNMFGLESILPELKKLNRKGIKFYLVNSPVPVDDKLKEEEIGFFVEKSYEIFINHFYDKNTFPSQNDETADHYPINIPYNQNAILLNSNKKLSSLIDSTVNPYQEIVNLIVNNSNNEIEPNQISPTTNKNLLNSIIGIQTGTSENEFVTELDLKLKFYPRKDYKYIFEKDKFLILGEKGVGKTALFSVLSHQKYAEALAKYCSINSQEVENTKWIIGFEKDNTNFPDKTNFESLKDFSLTEFRNYWVILLIRNLEENFFKEFDYIEIIENIIKSTVINLKNIAKEENIGEKLMQILYAVNKRLQIKNQFFIIVYDHLDAGLPVENDVRGKMVSSLVSFYYENINRLSNLKSKIFLRNDIFTREVKDVTDKVKILNYSQKIEWEYDQLLNVVWKRIYEQNKDSILFSDFKSKFEEDDILGSIPNLSSLEEHTLILDQIFGKNMGGNNKAYPYNWIRIHIEDTNNKIHPRTLIKLFSESANLELQEKDNPKDRLIRSKNIEKALEENVSPAQVQELREEYPELQNVFDNLYNTVPDGRSPMNEKDLENALEKLEENSNEIVVKLSDIGVLKEYKAYSKTKTNNEDKRFHIPDLYLYGLKFKRKGTR